MLRCLRSGSHHDARRRLAGGRARVLVSTSNAGTRSRRRPGRDGPGNRARRTSDIVSSASRHLVRHSFVRRSTKPPHRAAATLSGWPSISAATCSKEWSSRRAAGSATRSTSQAQSPDDRRGTRSEASCMRNRVDAVQVEAWNVHTHRLEPAIIARTTRCEASRGTPSALAPSTVMVSPPP